ncbi:aldehyde dehydrogenase family protein [Nocardia macrotermitis]|uniref:3-succinoylsemialdehyde-pyridine dehydrogenase n=1 Tax=Nocardia macrotermitis TaxID=2585198 RepID=A0A7K0DE74_9NOCA|nr:aldehyde dehydrogenase family protein [Nocardia macrotermitis]MQY24105.1 3-succinoylsemialdehyde-pyridine dehydrogenase [Nocardia macrotermitis]
MSEIVGETSSPSVELGLDAGRRAESRMLVDGALVPAASGAEFDNAAPATGMVLGATAAAGSEDMSRAIAAARRAFDETVWPTDRALRRRCLEQLQAALEAEKGDLGTELVAEAGCPVMTLGTAQVDWPLAESLRYPMRLIEEFAWERTLDGGGLFGDRNVRTVIQEPVGVVAAICPSNFPVEVMLNKLGPALAAGNTVVLKPDPHTPWNATRLGRIIAEHTEFPPGVVNIVPTPSNEVAALLATDPRVDMISFTGSTAVGRTLVRLGADTMKRTFLELGGKSALIVLPDADPVAALRSAAGVCVHAGQACAATTRMLVHHSVFEEMAGNVAAAFETIPVGDPALPHTLVGPLISPAAQRRVLDACTRAVADGARLITGGRIPDMPPDLSGGNWFSPTVFACEDPSLPIAQEEIFGPVLVMIPFVDDEDAVRIANHSVYGLAGAVLSGSAERGAAIARRVRTGAIGVNGGMFYGADAPFGGYKNSGIGRQCGLEGFAQYLETKTLAHRTPRQR